MDPCVNNIYWFRSPYQRRGNRVQDLGKTMNIRCRAFIMDLREEESIKFSGLHFIISLWFPALKTELSGDRLWKFHEYQDAASQRKEGKVAGAEEERVYHPALLTAENVTIDLWTQQDPSLMCGTWTCVWWRRAKIFEESRSDGSHTMELLRDARDKR
jgi:hypothetical protein